MSPFRRIPFALAAALLVACAGSDGPVAPADPVLTLRTLAPAAAVQARHEAGLLELPGVVGVGLGEDGRGGPAIVVLAGVPVGILVTGEIFALQAQQALEGPRKGPPCPPKCDDGGGGGGIDPTARFPRPVPIGVSTGHPDITAGTIGARVKSGNTVYALSNNHVYANSNAASINDGVLQPGAFDGGSAPGDVIGTLSAFQAITFSTSANNVIDAAIARSTTADVGNATPSNGYGTPRSQITTAGVNDRVMKYGRTTGQTKGRVLAVNATVNVNYGSPGVARFVDQIVIGGGGFSQGGDSGSLIVIEKGGDARKPVGLLFAGSSSTTIANPIDAVIQRFNVTIDGS